MIPPAPSLKTIRDVAIVGVYTFVMTFLSLLIGRGFAEHLSTLRDAALAAIAAVLAALGWGASAVAAPALTHTQRPQRHGERRTPAGPSTG